MGDFRREVAEADKKGHCGRAPVDALHGAFACVCSSEEMADTPARYPGVDLTTTTTLRAYP